MSEQKINRSLRSKGLALVIAFALAMSVAAFLVGRGFATPDTRNAQSKIPGPTDILAPVEFRTLEDSIITRGTIELTSARAVSLAGVVGGADDATSAQVVTRTPVVGRSVAEGDVLIEVAGRPVIVLKGTQPMYRSIIPGATGDDVNQLQESLHRLGLLSGAPSRTFDAGTQTAITALYTKLGFVTPSTGRAAITQLDELGLRVSSSEIAVRQAQAAIAEAATVKPDVVDDAQASFVDARSALNRAIDDAAKANLEADGTVATAKAARDAAKAAAEATPTDAVLQQAFKDAETHLTQSVQAQTAILASGKDGIESATARRDSATKRLALAKTPEVPESLRQQLTSAQRDLDTANKALAKFGATVGVVVPAGEVVFVPDVPSKIVGLKTSVGATATGELFSLAQSAVVLRARVGAEAKKRLTADAKIKIDAPDGTQIDGTVMADDSTTLSKPISLDEVLIEPKSSAPFAELVDSSARVTITAQSTDGKVFAVPVTALVDLADGTSRLEVVDSAGMRRKIAVKAGVTAGGFAQVTPIGTDTLKETDQVVVGIQSATTQPGLP